MDSLASEKCDACRRDSPPVTATEIEELKPQVPNWDLVEQGGIPRLARVFRFANFAEALAFTNRVGVLAEAEGHHPALVTEWGRVTVTWWSHKIHGPTAMTSSWQRRPIHWREAEAWFAEPVRPEAG